MTQSATASRRDHWSRVLIVIGAFLIFTAGFVVATTRGLLEPGQFAGRIARSLSDDRVAGYVADHLTDVVVAQKPDLIAVRPVILSTMTGIVRSDVFRGVVRTGARSVHRAIFEQAGKQVILSLPDVGTVLRSTLEQASPALAAKIPEDLQARLASGETERRAQRIVRILGWGERIRLGAELSFFFGAALVAVGVAVARDRRRGFGRAGVALVVVGLAAVAVTPAGRIVAALVFDDAASAGFLHGVWRAFYTNMRLIGVGIACLGLLLVAMGGAMLEAADPVQRAREFLNRLARTPAQRWRRFARAAAFLAAGALTILWPGTTAAIVAVVLGLALAYTGLRELSILIGTVSVAGPAGEAARGRRWPARVAAGAVGLATIAALVVFARGGATEAAPAGLPTACNGAAALCRRPVNRVIFPGAHNAMSNADVKGWMFPHHMHGVSRQLQDGIRALALDIHYGIPTGGAVKTNLDGTASREKIEEAVGPEGTAAAMRIRDRLVGGEDAERGIYFCHGFCELGAYEVMPTLREIREFLVHNPAEVLILVLEDYITPEDITRLFEESGLIDYVYTGSTTRWPTLHQLIAANQRLIVFIESGRQGAPWMHPTLGVIQETPYTFHKPDDMSCRPNRGGTTGSLFLINNWIETTPAPRPSNAEIVNGYDALLARARECMRERNHVPNIISVDFYTTGDLMRVVRTMNGVPEPPAPR